MPKLHKIPIIASNRSEFFSVKKPAKSPSARLNTLAPKSGEIPKNMAIPIPPYAPCDSPAPIKVILFMTISEPTTPHAIETKKAPKMAFCINSYWISVCIFTLRF